MRQHFRGRPTDFLSFNLSSFSPITNATLVNAHSTVMSRPETTPNAPRPCVNNESQYRTLWFLGCFSFSWVIHQQKHVLIKAKRANDQHAILSLIFPKSSSKYFLIFSKEILGCLSSKFSTKSREDWGSKESDNRWPPSPPLKNLKMYTMNKVLENIFLQYFISRLVSTFSTNSEETSCGPPRQGQQVTMTTPLSVASLIAFIRTVLESGILPLPYVTRTTPSIGGSKHPFIYHISKEKVTGMDERQARNSCIWKTNPK